MAKRYNFTEINFLLVDGNLYMRHLIAEILRSFGASRITYAADTDKAWEELRSGGYDILLLDSLVTPLDGCSFVKQLRTVPDSPQPTIPIIMLSGHTEAFKVAQARDSGVTEFLAKPVSADRLFRRLVAIIDKPRHFIRSKRYRGPDRRRRSDESYSGPLRRRDDPKPLEAQKFESVGGF